MLGRQADQRAVAVAVVDADRHVHPRPVHRAVRDQRLARQHIVQIADNRAGLVEALAAVFQHRDLAEGVARQVLGLGVFPGLEIDRHQIVFDALLGQDHPHRADIGGPVEAINREFL